MSGGSEITARQVVLPEQGPGGKGGRSTRALSIKQLIPLEGVRALDLGSHEGYNSFDLYECGCREVVGVELRDRLLRSAEETRRKLAYDGVRFVRADVREVDELGLGRFDLCLCSGLLYHMQNPYNLLKRIRNVCRILMLETHVSPPWHLYFLTRKKYRQNLSVRTHRVTLDGHRFSGRLNVFPPEQDMLETSGSIVSRCSFWLDRASLKAALELAGFRIVAFYYGSVPQGFPAIYVNHGSRRTKALVWAEVREPERIVPVDPGVISGCPQLLAPRA